MLILPPDIILLPCFDLIVSIACYVSNECLCISQTNCLKKHWNIVERREGRETYQNMQFFRFFRSLSRIFPVLQSSSAKQFRSSDALSSNGRPSNSQDNSLRKKLLVGKLHPVCSGYFFVYWVFIDSPLCLNIFVYSETSIMDWTKTCSIESLKWLKNHQLVLILMVYYRKVYWTIHCISHSSWVWVWYYWSSICTLTLSFIASIPCSFFAFENEFWPLYVSISSHCPQKSLFWVCITRMCDFPLLLVQWLPKNFCSRGISMFVNVHSEISLRNDH